ncbi:DUF5807 family protein [Halovivax sp.]|uniref:DUF5807 family protein n=1 Tax=Halovivax sp. TaxID=1935978 RepID=UPI0025BAC0E5|nr:DUF5807 family protein [Halovivax sp.]
MTQPGAAFLAGERPDDVAIYLSEAAADDLEKLASVGERVDGGVRIVVDGERGRNAFRAATGVEAMAFAKEAMGTDGDVAPDLAGGTCPEADAGEDTDGDHATRFVFAFAEAQNEEVGGIYAEGDVIHAYAQCACGTAYADKWVAEESAGESS